MRGENNLGTRSRETVHKLDLRFNPETVRQRARSSLSFERDTIEHNAFTNSNAGKSRVCTERC